MEKVQKMHFAIIYLKLINWKGKIEISAFQ